MLGNVFENFRNKFIEIYELGSAHFLSAPRLAWQTCLKKTEAKLKLLTDIDILLVFEKGTIGGICHSIHRHAKENNKYMKNFDKTIELSILMYLCANNLYGWAMFHKLPVNGFKWKKNVPKFDKEFVKNYDEDSNKGYIFEVDVKYPKDLHNLHSNLPFLSDGMKILKNAIFIIKKNMLFI